MSARFVIPVALALSACNTAKGVDVEASHLVPRDADFVIGFEVDALSKSPVGAALASVMRDDADMAAMFPAFQRCEIDLDHLEGIIAGTFDSDTFMGVLESPGLGQESVVRCIEKEISKATGEDTGLILFETKGDVRTTPQEGGGHLIILNKNAIVISDAVWDEEILAAIADASKRNTETPLASLMAAAGADTDMWVAAVLGDAERTEIGDLPGGEGLSGVLFRGGLADGVALDGTFSFRGEANAEAFATGMTPLVEEAKAGLGEAGMPATLLDTLKFRHEGESATFEWAIAADVLPGIMAVVAATM